jgi:hypothetical protein
MVDEPGVTLTGLAGLDATIADMMKQIDDLPKKMYQELTDWQTQDVKFRVPYTSVIDRYTVETIIWPRGRRKKSGKYQGRTHRGRRTRRVRVRSAGKYKHSQAFLHKRSKLISGGKPLLRPFLYDKLVLRMSDLLETIKWR